MSTDHRTRWLLSLVLGLFVGLPACSGGDSNAIRIGAALPLSGKHANVGGFFRDGYQLAVQEANAQGRRGNRRRSASD